MTIKYVFKYLYLAVMTATLTLANGCGKQENPDPPLTNSRLLLQIFAALKENSHETAYNQISRLVAIEKSDIFLNTLKNTELCNIYLEKAQKQINRLQFKEAAETIQTAMFTYGRSKSFLNAMKDIEILTKIQILMPRLESPRNGSELEKDTSEMVSLLEKLPFAKNYAPKFKEKLELSKSMQMTEHERAMFSLYSEIVSQRQLGNERLANLLTAEFYSCEPSPYMQKIAVQLQNDIMSPKDQ